MINALRRARDRRRRRRFYGRDPARSRGLVRCARREARVPAPQGLRRVHRGAEPRVARRARRGRRVSRAGRPAARATSGSSPATTSCTPTAALERRNAMGPRARPREARHAAARARDGARRRRLSAVERRRRRAPRWRARVHARDEPRGRVGDGRGKRADRRARLLGAAADCGDARARRSARLGFVRVQSELLAAPTSHPACCRCSHSTADTAAWCSGTAAS